MIEQERLEAAAEAAYTYYNNNPAPDRRWVSDDAPPHIKWYFRQLAARVYDTYLGARPGPPCTHEEYHDTGRCANMGCSNYISSHIPPVDVPVEGI